MDALPAPTSSQLAQPPQPTPRNSATKRRGELDRTRVPDWLSYADRFGLALTGRGPWRSMLCEFHADRVPSLRVNTTSGGWCCMSCGESGGDVIAFHMRLRGTEFIETARELGCWRDGDGPAVERGPARISAGDALTLCRHSAYLIAVGLADIGHGRAISEVDRATYMEAARVIVLAVGAWEAKS